MGFGFVVARFGLFLRELTAMRGDPAAVRTGLSTQFGTVLVLLGVAIDLAGVRYRRTLARLDAGRELRPPTSPALAFAGVLGAIGCAMAVYLLAVPD